MEKGKKMRAYLYDFFDWIRFLFDHRFDMIVMMVVMMMLDFDFLFVLVMMRWLWANIIVHINHFLNICTFGRLFLVLFIVIDMLMALWLGMRVTFFTISIAIIVAMVATVATAVAAAFVHWVQVNLTNFAITSTLFHHMNLEIIFFMRLLRCRCGRLQILFTFLFRLIESNRRSECNRCECN